MSLVNLSRNEKVVLFCLIKAPLLNDRQIASYTGIKMSTITAIRNRLSKRELYSTVRVPLLPPERCELLHLSVIPVANVKGKQRPTLVREICSNIPEVSLCTLDSEALLLGMARNYPDYKQAKHTFIDGLVQRGLYHDDTGWDHIFSLGGCDVSNLYDHSHLLSIHFQKKGGIEMPTIRLPSIASSDITPISTSVERKVYLGLIRYPMSPDTKLSEHIHITRQIIAKLRNRFEKERLMKTVRLVNLKRMGFKVLSFVSMSFDPAATIKSKKRAQRFLSSEMPVVFSVSDKLKGCALLVFADFQEARAAMTSLSDNLAHGGLLGSPLEYRFFSIPDQSLAVFHDHAPLVEKVLGSEV